MQLFQKKLHFFSYLFYADFIYNLSFRLPLYSIHKNWKGKVRQYPVKARSATVSMAADLIAIPAPKFS